MTLWWLSLALAAAVVVVVALLLDAIARTARSIERTARSIWDGGGRIANNTVHVPDLRRTNRRAASLLQRAPALKAQLRRIAAHAESCSHCPTCVLGGRE